MRLPSEDRTFELFWRQAVRWLAAPTPDPVSIAPVMGMASGDAAPIGSDGVSGSGALMPNLRAVSTIFSRPILAGLPECGANF